MSVVTADTYDEMPYMNRAFAQTHPDRLATIGTLFGITPAALDSCRVLELGSASGDNLIPMALTLPNARFVGVDLSQRQTEQGQQVVDALRLGNIELRQADIMAVDPSYGEFDYIVCHGIFSWVPPAVREKIFRICSCNLAPNGIAYVSYNALPGWHMRGMVREMMRYHTAALPQALAQVQQARSLLEFLAQNVSPQLPYGMVLRQERDSISSEPDAYVFHDHLEANNDALYFHQFVEWASRHDLQYLGEAVFSSMMLEQFQPGVRDTLRRIAADVIRMEQYIDFVRGRTFRQTLLVHQNIRISRQPDWQVIKSCYVASPAQPVALPASPGRASAQSFRAPNGLTIATSNEITKAALHLLCERWPLGLTFHELASASTKTLPAGSSRADDEKILGVDLLRCYAADMLELRVKAPPIILEPGGFPLASPLARLQVKSGNTVTNLRHEAVRLDSADVRLLQLLDGTRDRNALKAAFESSQSIASTKQPHAPDVSAQGARSSIDLEQQLSRLARQALMAR